MGEQLVSVGLLEPGVLEWPAAVVEQLVLAQQMAVVLVLQLVLDQQLV